MIRTATHLFARKNLCREHGEGEKGRCDAAIHLFTSKNLCREHGEGEKDEPKPHHTAQHDTIIPQNHKTTTHHTTSYHTTSYHIISHHIIPHHITTISKPDNTTNRQNPIPCLKHHTLQHYTTKALPPKSWRKSFINLSANRLS